MFAVLCHCTCALQYLRAHCGLRFRAGCVRISLLSCFLLLARRALGCKLAAGCPTEVLCLHRSAVDFLCPSESANHLVWWFPHSPTRCWDDSVAFILVHEDTCLEQALLVLGGDG